MVKSSSDEYSKESSPEIKKQSPRFASSLTPGSQQQIRLVQDRISRDLCLECGVLRSGRGGSNANFCGACLTGYPKTIDLEEAIPCDGWKWAVIQRGPAIPGLGLFHAMRVGIFEYEGRSRLIAFGLDTFADAKAAAMKDHNRVLCRAGMYV